MSCTCRQSDRDVRVDWCACNATWFSRKDDRYARLLDRLCRPWSSQQRNTSQGSRHGGNGYQSSVQYSITGHMFVCSTS